MEDKFLQNRMETCFHKQEQNRMGDMFLYTRVEQNGGHVYAEQNRDMFS